MIQHHGMLAANSRQDRRDATSDKTQMHKEHNIGDAPIIVRSNEAYGKLGIIVTAGEYDNPNAL